MPGIMQMVANNVRTTVVEDADYTPPNFVSSGLIAYYDPSIPLPDKSVSVEPEPE